MRLLSCISIKRSGIVTTQKQRKQESRGEFFRRDTSSGKRDGKSYRFLRLKFVAPLTRLTEKKESQTSLPPENECIIAAEGHDKEVVLATTESKRSYSTAWR